jgi:hypothetical protein
MKLKFIDSVILNGYSLFESWGFAEKNVVLGFSPSGFILDLWAYEENSLSRPLKMVVIR